MASQGLNVPGVSQALHCIAVVGPTASGKTELAIELARRLGGEIISADSRQMYRRLDAGTAKPRGGWDKSSDGKPIFRTDGVAYHLVDILDPRETMDAGRFAELARPILDGIRGRGNIPIVAGGTGLYLRALLEGLDPLPKRDPAIRERLAELAEANGPHWLHERLAEVDPEAAMRIPAKNIHRVVRALEVYELTGKPITAQWTRAPTDKNSGAREPSTATAAQASQGPVLYVGIRWARAELQERIRARAAAMFPRMLEEVARLVPGVYSGLEPGFKSLGYPQALRRLKGEMTQDQALASMIRDTFDYAKRQATWFGRQVSVCWIAAGAGSTASTQQRAVLGTHGQGVGAEGGGEPASLAESAVELIQARVRGDR